MLTCRRRLKSGAYDVKLQWISLAGAAACPKCRALECHQPLAPGKLGKQSDVTDRYGVLIYPHAYGMKPLEGA